MQYYVSRIDNEKEVSHSLLDLEFGPCQDEGYLSIGWRKIDKEFFLKKCRESTFSEFNEYCKKNVPESDIKRQFRRSLYNFLNFQNGDIIVVPRVYPDKKDFSIVRVIGNAMPIGKLSEVNELSFLLIGGSKLRFQDNGIIVDNRNEPLDIGFVIKVKRLKTMSREQAAAELDRRMNLETPTVRIVDSKIQRQIQQALEQSDTYSDGEELSNMNSDNVKLVKQLANILLSSKNIILRGAPGTGKTYLAKQIAAYIVNENSYCEYDQLSSEQKKQIEFVQFHPSYDYTDFVEGLRPIEKDNSIGFNLKAGVFKAFVENVLPRSIIMNYLKAIDVNITEINKKNQKDKNNVTFKIEHYDEQYIYTNGRENSAKQDSRKIKIKIDDLCKMLESKESFNNVQDVKPFVTIKPSSDQENTYYWGVYMAIKEYMEKNNIDNKNYVFIIDEINRGEISKIFGELFFSIDPGYRGPSGKVKTQYANLHKPDEEDFYIPENVYIIGTMNDIDRSVDSFDFAMRRRFRFVEIKVIEEDSDNQSKKDDNQKLYEISRNTDIILDSLKDKDNKSKVEERIINLNKAISNTPGLNANYHIGAAYFLKLNDDGVNFNVLWDDYLEPLLQEYVRGMSDEAKIMEKFKEAYNKSSETTAKDTEAGDKK